MIIKIQKTSSTHHIFSYIRKDGTGEEKELESKSFLLHDLLHFCVESEAHTEDGFFGALKKGRTLSSLRSLNESENKNMMVIEQIVGALTGITKGADVSHSYEYLRDLWKVEGTDAPEFFTKDFISRVEDMYRRIIGKWKSVPFGETMVLESNI